MVDFTIVGQGLAGTALAWHLLWRDARILILDRDDTATASRIAAGLITPITGKRFALDPDFARNLDIAKDYYRRIESLTGESFYLRSGAVRILRDDAERERSHSREVLKSQISEATLDPDMFVIPRGVFAMPAAARLDIPSYLSASRLAFGDRFRIGTFEDAKGTVIDCTGIAALREARLPQELFQPAKGEILTIRCPGLTEDRTIHHGLWLARMNGDLYRAGATYSWDALDDFPTPAGRDELVSRLNEFLKMQYEVIRHDAATRPISIDRLPIIRQVASDRWVFNGLGSKGTLLAPGLAQQLVELLT